MKKTLIYALLSLFVIGGVFASSNPAHLKLAENKRGTAVTFKDGSDSTKTFQALIPPSPSYADVMDAVKGQVRTGNFKITVNGHDMTDADARALTKQSTPTVVHLK